MVPTRTDDKGHFPLLGRARQMLVGQNSMCGRSLEQNLGGWLLLAEEAGRLSYQTQGAGAVRSGHYLFLSTRYLVAKCPRARTF